MSLRSLNNPFKKAWGSGEADSPDVFVILAIVDYLQGNYELTPEYEGYITMTSNGSNKQFISATDATKLYLHYKEEAKSRSDNVVSEQLSKLTKLITSAASNGYSGMCLDAAKLNPSTDLFIELEKLGYTSSQYIHKSVNGVRGVYLNITWNGEEKVQHVDY